jgi:NAD(P)-dependent dehydrogenase (short-subunit alcohol dehydrogenase family)
VAIVLALAGGGAKVAVVARREAALCKTVSETVPLGADELHATADVSQRDDVERAAARNCLLPRGSNVEYVEGRGSTQKRRKTP